MLTSRLFPSGVGSIVEAPQTTPRQQKGWSAEGPIKSMMQYGPRLITCPGYWYYFIKLNRCYSTDGRTNKL